MAKVAGLSAQQLYKLISSHSFTSASLEFLRLANLHADIFSLHSQVLLLEEVLLSRKELPLTKYHALLAVQQLMQTALYAGLLFLEIYLCPILADISLCLTRRRNEEQLEGYFIQRGYRESAALRKLSHKFVNKAGALVLLAAAIKPYQNVVQTQIAVPSRFQLVAAVIRESGAVLNEQFSHKECQSQRVSYLQYLKGLNAQVFGTFISKKLKQDIVFKQGISNNTRKLIDSEDASLSFPAINLCVSMLSNMSTHFPHKRTYLSLFNSFIRQGQVYAIIVAHNAPFISDIFQEIIKIKGQQGLTAGRFIYPQVQGSMQDKYNFYCEFLKCLQIWATCLPQNQIGEQSQIFKYYSYLREERKFVFPEILLWRRAHQQFNRCLQEKQLQNQQILRIIETDDKLMAEYARIKSSVIQLSLNTSKIGSKPLAQPQRQKQSSSSYSNSRESNNAQEIREKLRSIIRLANLRIQNLIKQSKVAENMQALKSFSKQWINLKQSYKKQLSSSIIKEGDSLKQKITQIYPLYLRLKKKAFQFNSFKNKVASILGIQIQLVCGDKFDDYSMNQYINNQNNEQSPCNKAVLQDSNQISKVSINLGCQSNLKHDEIIKETAYNNQKQLQGLSSPVNKSCQINVQTNQYGIKHLLRQRKELLNISKRSNDSRKLDNKAQQYSLNQIVLFLLIKQNKSSNQYSKISKRSAKVQVLYQSQYKSRQSQVNPPSASKHITFSQPSENSSNQIQQTINQQDRKHNNMNVYQVYQFQIEDKKNAKQINSSSVEYKQYKEYEDNSTNLSCSIRSRLYLQKIRYSSTRRAIQDYSRQVGSLKSLSNNSRTTNKSIIQKQYKRIALQQYRQPQSLSKIQKDDCSQSNANISFFSNNSKKQINFSKTILSLHKYDQFFTKDKSSKIGKNMLKSKCLLHSCDDLEVGFVHFRKENTLSIILYLTPLKNITILHFQIVSCPYLSIHYENSPKQLKKNIQQITKLEASVKKTPYHLPIIKIKLKSHGSQSKSIQFFLPCTFNKFVSCKNIDSIHYQNAIKECQSVIQSPTFRLLDPHLYQKKISKFFSLPCNKHPSKGTRFILECAHQATKFMLEVQQVDKDTGIITACSPTQHIAEIQFLLCTLGYALTLF